MELGEIVRSARVAKGWTQEALAERLGVGRPFVSQLETGARDVSRETLRALVLELDLDPAAVLDIEPPAEASRSQV